MKSIFNTATTRLLTCISLILFCSLVFAEGVETTEEAKDSFIDLIVGFFTIGFVVVYFIFIIYILVLFFKKWNRTNKILEEISKSVEEIAKK